MKLISNWPKIARHLLQCWSIQSANWQLGMDFIMTFGINMSIGTSFLTFKHFHGKMVKLRHFDSLENVLKNQTLSWAFIQDSMQKEFMSFGNPLLTFSLTKISSQFSPFWVRKNSNRLLNAWTHYFANTFTREWTHLLRNMWNKLNITQIWCGHPICIWLSSK